MRVLSRRAAALLRRCARQGGNMRSTLRGSSGSRSSAAGNRAIHVKALDVLLAVVFTAAQLIAAVPSVTFPQPHSTIFISRDQDVQLGQEAKQQAAKEFPLVSDSDPLTQYIKRLGQSMIQYVPEPRFPYEFHVVNQKEINAFALPGGPVFVNVGTIQASDNEAQLAGVIAHEMGHVYMRHGAELASNQMKAQLGIGVLGAILGHGIGAQLGQLGASLVASGLLLKNSRSAESEADAVGARILYLAGYNPKAMSDFFHKLEQQGGASGPQMLSDHPNPGNRAAAIDALIKKLPSRSYNASTGQFAQAKQLAQGRQPYTAEQIAQMQKSGRMPGDSGGGNGQITAPPQGGGITASSQFKQLDHQAFTIAYPSDWRVYGDQSSAVTIAPEGGVSQDAIAYGVVINGMQPESRDLDGAFHELQAQLRQSNPDLRFVGRDETIRVNGVQGKSIEAIGPSPISSQGKQVRERDWLVALPDSRGELISLIFIAPEPDYPRLRPVYEQMLRSFRPK
jgi:hypothetical protein